MAKWTLHRERLNSGGYTAFGTYYGAGQPLYVAHDEDTGEVEVFRAANRQKAKEAIREHFDTNATFYR